MGPGGRRSLELDWWEGEDLDRLSCEEIPGWEGETCEIEGQAFGAFGAP